MKLKVVTSFILVIAVLGLRAPAQNNAGGVTYYGPGAAQAVLRQPVARCANAQDRAKADYQACASSADNGRNSGELASTKEDRQSGKMNRGKLITFEGIDGCGKTTQLRLLERILTSKNIPFVSTREPGGTELGKLIRAALLNVARHKVEPLAELLLYAADRAQHVPELCVVRRRAAGSSPS